MINRKRKALLITIIKVLRPLIKILLRNGISYGTFSDIAKWLFVDISMKKFTIEGRKQSISRVSIITGINRKEVKRVLHFPKPEDCAERYNRASRVIAGWQKDKDFLTKSGKPAVIPFSGKGATFENLVRRYSGDMPVRAILDELSRINAVIQTKTNCIRLLSAHHPFERDEITKIKNLGAEVGQLISSLGHNIGSNERDSGT
jgi:hypothetical protein